MAWGEPAVPIPLEPAAAAAAAVAVTLQRRQLLHLPLMCRPFLTPRAATPPTATAGPRNGNLDLRAGTSYSQLVNVIARGENIIRVAPGDPNASYLVIKLEGNQSSGSRMPRGQPALSSAKIQLIRDWITAGAEND